MFEEPQQIWEHPLAIDTSPSANVTRVVALGVGDAGLAALKRFFIALDEGCGMAFVVVQHTALTAHAAFALPELLRQLTDLPVVELEPGMALSPDHVFVAAPGDAWELSAEQLFRPSVYGDEPFGQRTVVDRLFRSLAHSVGSRAIGIVLPGTGSDGALGVQAIARTGGTTYAIQPFGPQAYESGAPFSMLESAIATGCVNHVLSPFQIAQALTEPELFEWSQSAAPRASTREELAHDNAALLQLNRQLFSIHGRLQQRLAELRSALDHAQSRNTALSNTYSELSVLLGAAPLVLVFLDDRLCVQSYSGDIDKLFVIGDADIGRPLAHLEHRAHEMPPLPAMHELVRNPHLYDADIVTTERWFVRRIMVRDSSSQDATQPSRPTGVVIVFLDVTKLKDSEAAAHPHDEWLRTITDAVPSVISYVDEAIARI